MAAPPGGTANGASCATRTHGAWTQWVSITRNPFMGERIGTSSVTCYEHYIIQDRRHTR